MIDLARWIETLRRMAEPVLARLDPDAELERALAQPSGLAGPLIARCLGRACSTPRDIGDDPRRYGDVALWWALTDSSIEAGKLVDFSTSGPLFDQNAYATIEVWIETELAGLHALAHYDGSAERVHRTVEYHLEHTQPDNATCHPWSIHVFVTHGTPESRHLAETMLSNCLVRNAEPDSFSAWILLDAAAALEALTV